MRRVLHLKMVTQCAMLEDFGIFLVLADKVCGLYIVHFPKLHTASVAGSFCLSYRGPRTLLAQLAVKPRDGASEVKWEQGCTIL